MSYVGYLMNTLIGGTASPVSPQWDEITGKPAAFPPASHDHVIGEVTGLEAALAAGGGGGGTSGMPAVDQAGALPWYRLASGALSTPTGYSHSGAPPDWELVGGANLVDGIGVQKWGMFNGYRYPENPSGVRHTHWSDVPGGLLWRHKSTRQLINRLVLYLYDHYRPTGFVLDGSDDSETWHNVLSVTDIDWSQATVSEEASNVYYLGFQGDNTVPYYWHRLTVTGSDDVGSSANVMIVALEGYGASVGWQAATPTGQGAIEVPIYDSVANTVHYLSLAELKSALAALP